MTTIGLSYSLVKISTKCAPALPDYRGRADTVFNACMAGQQAQVTVPSCNPKTEDKNTESEFDVDALLATPAVMQRLMSVLMQRISVAQ